VHVFQEIAAVLQQTEKDILFAIYAAPVSLLITENFTKHFQFFVRTSSQRSQKGVAI